MLLSNVSFGGRMTFQQHGTALDDPSWASWNDQTAQWDKTERARSAPLVGKLIAMGGEHPCMVRNMTDTGMTFETTLPLTIGEKVTVEVESLAPTDATVQARDGLSITIEFLQPQSQTWTPAGGPREDFTLRAPRFSLIEPARMRVGSLLLQVRTLDVSLAGAKIDVSNAVPVPTARDLFTAGALTLLNVRGMNEPKLGEVKWWSLGKIGVMFQSPLAAGEMTRILNQHTSALAGSTFSGRRADGPVRTLS
jgi:hypothetical protein